MSEVEIIDELVAVKRRLRAELLVLDKIIDAVQGGVWKHRRQLARYELGEIWGATKLARHLGVSRNTAYKLMRTEFADLVREDWEGRLCVGAADVERRLSERRPAA
jgi:hypothetical protein